MAVLVLLQAGHQAGAKAVGVGGAVFEAGKIVFCPVEPVQAIDGPDPEIVVPVLIDAPDIVVAQAGRIGRVVPVHDYFIPVVPVQPVPGAKPHKPFAVLVNGFDGAVGQSLLVGDMGEFQLGRLGGQEGGATGQRRKTYNIVLNDKQVPNLSSTG